MLISCSFRAAGESTYKKSLQRICFLFMVIRVRIQFAVVEQIIPAQ